MLHYVSTRPHADYGDFSKDIPESSQVASRSDELPRFTLYHCRPYHTRSTAASPSLQSAAHCTFAESGVLNRSPPASSRLTIFSSHAVPAIQIWRLANIASANTASLPTRHEFYGATPKTVALDLFYLAN